MFRDLCKTEELQQDLPSPWDDLLVQLKDHSKNVEVRVLKQTGTGDEDPTAPTATTHKILAGGHLFLLSSRI